MPKKCPIRDFWNAWSPLIQSGGFITVFTMLCTIIWWTFNFVKDTQAYAPEIYMQHRQIAVVYLKGDRTERNLERMMQKMGVKPIPPDERELEATRNMEDAIGQEP